MPRAKAPIVDCGRDPLAGRDVSGALREADSHTVGARAAARSALDVMLTDAAIDDGGVGRFVKPATAAKVAMALARRPRRLAGRVRELGGGVALAGLGRSQLAAPKSDRRFADPAWQGNWLLRRVLQVYLAAAETVDELIRDADLDWRSERLARFAATNILDALAPTNFPWCNPVVLREIVDTGGANLVRGGRNFVADMSHAPHLPASVDTSQFELGENLALSPGSVVLRTKVFELIQYRPSTKGVREVPLLFAPPTINRYYILDLAPGRSLVEYLVGEGQQVFMMSWRNPEAAQGHFELDNARAGTAAAFVDRETAAVAVADSARKGYVDGQALAGVFAWLRPNDLVWNYVVNNYLLGRDPPAFDILYWNQDSVRLAAGLHRDFVMLALQNSLTRPGATEVLGTPVDLGAVTVDSYIVAGLRDHIVPWENAQRSAELLGGNSRFVLSTSGHIQSLVNPPRPESRASYRLTEERTDDVEAWLARADVKGGSWWPDYSQWLAERSGELRDAPRTLGSSKHRATAKAPGTYVHAG